MKVAIISSCFGSYGGIEAFVLALARFLQKEGACFPKIIWKKAGDFQMSEALLQRCQQSDVPFVFVPPRSPLLWQEIRSADMIHAQNSPPDVVLFSKLQCKPLLLTVHNRRVSGYYWRSQVWYGMQRLADRRWYNSAFVRHSWEGKVISQGSAVVPTVSDLPQGEIPYAMRKGFCFASRWIPNKGADVLLKAYAQAELDPDTWPLHLIGDGPLLPSLRKQYQSTPGIYFCGFVAEMEKAERIRSSKWMVVPPCTQEDLGLTAIEARSVGVPCVITRDGGLPEAAGSSAILCEPGDVKSLKRGLQEAAAMSEGEYSNRAKESRESLNSFLVPLSKYREEYENLLRSSSR